MKMRLICQEGPGAGDVYTLDPDQQTVYSMGRSSECDLVLRDQRSSRHHADIRWTGSQWQVVDRGSTNGSFVNGLQVHRPYDLRSGDRLTIGETTMIVQQEQAGQPHPRSERAPAAARAGEAQVAGRGDGGGRSGSGGVIFWLAQGLVIVAVICLAAGAFLPWIEISGSLSRDLQPLVQGIADLIASLSGQDSLLHVSQRIGGLEGYGKLTLGIAVVSALALVVDIFFYRRSVVPAIVYLGTGIVSIGAMGFDLANYYRYYQDLQNLSLLFGIQLGEVVQVFDHFIEMKASPMAGLFLTGAGLVLLLAGGITRLVAVLLGRQETR